MCSLSFSIPAVRFCWSKLEHDNVLPCFPMFCWAIKLACPGPMGPALWPMKLPRDILVPIWHQHVPFSHNWFNILTVD